MPLAAGGLADTLARIVAQRLGEASGQAVVVENRPGGAGAIGAEAAARAPADGYTLFMGGLSTNAVLAHLTKLTFDPAKDLAPIIHVATFPNVLVVNPGLPVKSVAELVAYAKANPGKLSYASQGNAASGHLVGEQFKQLAGIDDGARALSRRRAGDPGSGRRPRPGDVRQRHAAGAADQRRQDPRARGAHAAADRVDAATCRPWARAASARCRAAPGSACSRPPARRARRSLGSTRETRKAFAVEQVRQRYLSQGTLLPLGSPDEFAAHIAAERQRWGEVIREANIRLE